MPYMAGAKVAFQIEIAIQAQRSYLIKDRLRLMTACRSGYPAMRKKCEESNQRNGEVEPEPLSSGRREGEALCAANELPRGYNCG